MKSRNVRANPLIPCKKATACSPRCYSTPFSLASLARSGIRLRSFLESLGTPGSGSIWQLARRGDIAYFARYKSMLGRNMYSFSHVTVETPVFLKIRWKSQNVGLNVRPAGVAQPVPASFSLPEARRAQSCACQLSAATRDRVPSGAGYMFRSTASQGRAGGGGMVVRARLSWP
jgi:hypothetical protein